MALGQLPADMPEFLEVERARALGGLDPERSVAPGAAAAFDMIGALGRVGQREEGFGLVLGTVDQRVGNAVAGDDREAIFGETVPELLGEGIGIAVGVRQRDGGDVVVSDRGNGVDLSSNHESRQRGGHQVG